MARTDHTVLSLFDYSGVWGSAFLPQAEVVLVDSQHPKGWSVRRGRGVGGDQAARPHLWGVNLAVSPEDWAGLLVDLLMELRSRGLPPVHGVLAAPPCDCFTKASAHLWDEMDVSGRTAKALKMVDCALLFAEGCETKFWCLENPPGRLWNKGGTGMRQAELGELGGQYRPCDYGATKEQTKLTYLWGRFVMPPMTRRVWGPPKYKGGVDPVTRTGGSARTRKIRRATTPVEFARAFASVNRLEE